ncbi:hypothetical protein DPMN_116443 [Dreissena polymorpha]|uniref:Uncharacterized protein n=1 Tax=Dreissena polymorpha TaxID=45954 RepID=A0A9D4KPF8_DREPO|nr:hypothetical protein DPMN_116443 [Dreissena polymorpha]
MALSRICVFSFEFRRLKQATAQSTVYNNSFYPRTISQWNQLPILVTDSTCLEGFKTALVQLRASPSRTA